MSRVQGLAGEKLQTSGLSRRRDNERPLSWKRFEGQSNTKSWHCRMVDKENGPRGRASSSDGRAVPTSGRFPDYADIRLPVMPQKLPPEVWQGGERPPL